MIITPTRKGTKDVPPFWKAPRLWRRLYSAKWGIWDMNRTQFIHDVKGFINFQNERI